MKRSRKLVSAVILLLVLIWSGVMLSRQPPVSFSAPRQNGYQLFLRAIASMPDNATPDPSNQQAVATFVLESTEAYALVHSGLKMACGVPVQASKQWYAQHMGKELPGLRALTYALIAKAKQAELEGRTAEAFEAYIEAYRFADAIGRGGLVADFLYSMRCKSLVLQDCQTLIAFLTPTQKSEFLNLIRRLEAAQDGPAAVAERTRQWQRATFGLKGRVAEWREALQDVWQSRSWAPLTGRITLAGRTAFYQKTYMKPICERLAAATDLNERRTEPSGPANGSPPFQSETNSTSPADGALR